MGLVLTRTVTEYIVTPSLSMEFNPAIWNNLQDTISSTNCYTYALNSPELETIDLGEEARKHNLHCRPDFFTASVGLDEKKLDELAKSDGLERIREHDFNPLKNHIVALLGGMPGPSEANAGDFHFYRLDRDGTWSHQPYKRAKVTNRTESGELISIHNLHDNYAINKCASRFVGYYRVCPSGMSIKCYSEHVNQPVFK